jgi:hypothetical protein
VDQVQLWFRKVPNVKEVFQQQSKNQAWGG